MCAQINETIPERNRIHSATDSWSCFQNGHVCKTIGQQFGGGRNARSTSSDNYNVLVHE